MVERFFTKKNCKVTSGRLVKTSNIFELIKEKILIKEFQEGGIDKLKSRAKKSE